jgi:hypothetical protein
MGKRISNHIWYALLISKAAFMLTACGVVTLTITKTPQLPTAVPPYIHYSSSETFNIHLEFDYPGSWIFSEEKIRDTDIIFVGLGDPRLLTVPTRAPNEPHGTPSDFGRVSIMIQPAKPGQTLDVLIEPYKQGHNSASWVTALNEDKITIDGYDAIVLEYQVEPIDYNGYTSMMFERNIFFVVKDQLYQITFLVADKERGGEFEKGYEYFFNSLKIVP